MSNTLILNQPYITSGLNTMTYTVAATGTYNISVQCTEIPPSSLSIVVNNNGSPIYTAPVVTSTQSALQFKFDFLATAADVITVVLSSAASIDNQLNNIKTNIAISGGL